MAAKAIAEIAPSEAVNAVLTGEGVADGYKAAFTVEVLQEGGKWLLSAELTPLAWTNLVDCATAATLQIPVAEIAMFPMAATTNVVLTGCMPGFYYSLCSGTTVTNITADAEAENIGVLCGVFIDLLWCEVSHALLVLPFRSEQLVDVNGFIIEQRLRHEVHVVAHFRLYEVVCHHGVPKRACHIDSVIGEYLDVVLDVLTYFECFGIFV